MMNDKLKLRALHADIDERFNQKLKQLEEERKRDHEALDRIWPSLKEKAALLFSSGNSGEGGLGSQSSTTKASDEGDSRFQMRAAVLQIIENLDPNADVSMPVVYEGLVSRYPELKEHPKPVQLRAQIATTLGRLVKQDKLKLDRKGFGSDPHIYKKVNKLQVKIDQLFADDSEGEKEEAAVAPATSASP